MGLAAQYAEREKHDVAQRRAGSVGTSIVACAREWERMADRELYVKFEEADNMAANEDEMAKAFLHGFVHRERPDFLIHDTGFLDSGGRDQDSR